MTRISGALAAAVTPLRDGGGTIDEEALAPLLELYAAAGLDGVLLLGTTGEGILLDAGERRRVVERALADRPDGLAVAVHCGAQTSADTAALARHAADRGADAVAVIGPPYYALDQTELLEHFAAAAAACAPTPFYVYEFAARTGYAVPLPVLERLRQRAPNLAGLKVSDAPFERFEPYLLEGLDVFIGPESLIAAGLARGAVGAVSGLAAGFPELVRDAVASGSEEDTRRAGEARAIVQRYPFQSALKTVLAARGAPVRPDVRGPLRTVTREERDELLHALEGLVVAG